MRLARLAAVTMLVIAVVAAPIPGEGQQTTKVYRIGFVTAVSPERAAVFVNALRQGLHELGYADGQIVIDVRAAAGRADGCLSSWPN